jgi:putative tricarboxylic transport membrane protein
VTVIAVVVALATLALGAGYLALGTRLPLGSLEQPGAAFFPLVTGMLILTAGLAVAAELLRPGAARPALPGVALRRVGATTAALVGFALALPLAGYLPSIFGLLVVVLRVFGLERWSVTLGLALALTAVSWYGFASLLGVPLPRGPWAP